MAEHECKSEDFIEGNYIVCEGTIKNAKIWVLLEWINEKDYGEYSEKEWRRCAIITHCPWCGVELNG